MVPAVATQGKSASHALATYQCAERLGAVYNYLAGIRALPFGKWAVPEFRADHGPFLQALGFVYLVDKRGAKSIGSTVVADRSRAYRADYDTVIPSIRTAALKFTKAAFDAEENVLTTLLTKLEQDPQEPERLQAIARQVAKEVRLEPTLGEWARMLEGKIDETEWRRSKRKQVARALSKRVHSDLSTLFAHPDGVGIVAAFSKSGGEGIALAAGHVRRSIDALRDFRREINDVPDNVWRYPFFIMGGAQHLGLAEVPGFKEYATSIASVLASGKWEDVVGFAGMVVACLGLVFTGPLGLAVLGAADLALSSVGTALAYMRERERELAGTASQFRAAGDEFAVKAGYRDTVMSGAAALLSAIAFFKATREFRELIKPRLAPAEMISAPRSAISGEARAGRLPPPGEGMGASRGAPRSEAIAARGNAREPSGATNAKEAATQALEETGAASRANARGFTAGTDAQAQMVSQGPLPAGLRKNLEEQIQTLESTVRVLETEKAAIQRELRTVNDQMDGLRLLGRTQTDEYRALTERREVLKKQQETIGSLADLNIRKMNARQELNALLRVSERDYFDDLTNAARRRPDFVAVATGEIDTKIFNLAGGETEVDHLFPRIEIWNTAGFKENLTRDQQVFLFAYRGNLKRMAWQLNNARGIRRYNSLPSQVWGKYVRDGEALLQLDRKALEMREHITMLINNPGNAELWKRHGYVPRF